MHATLSPWCWQQHLGWKMRAEENRRQRARELTEPPFRVICGHCGYWWDQMAPEKGVAAYFASLSCHRCYDRRITVMPNAAKRLQQIIDR
jgi:hypothetical protein